MIEINLPNMPIPWTCKIGRGKMYNPHSKELALWRWQVKALYRGDPIPGYVNVELTFYFPPPNSASKKMKAKMLSGEIIPTSCDCTNLQKFCEDAIKNILFTDDRNVAFISSRKLYGSKENVLIRVWPHDANHS